MKWTNEQEQLLSKLYPDTKTKELCKIFDCKAHNIYNKANKMGLRKSNSYLYAEVYTITPNVESQFKKNHTPWNKGMKGLQMGGVETQFKKGSKPHNWKPDGSTRVDKDGFTMIKVNGKYVLYHRHLWIQENGKVPEGYVVAFKDGDKSNITLDNLELITKQENMARNTVHRLPEEIKEVIHLKKTITRITNGKRQNSRP